MLELNPKKDSFFTPQYECRPSNTDISRYFRVLWAPSDFSGNLVLGYFFVYIRIRHYFFDLSNLYQDMSFLPRKCQLLMVWNPKLIFVHSIHKSVLGSILALNTNLILVVKIFNPRAQKLHNFFLKYDWVAVLAAQLYHQNFRRRGLFLSLRLRRNE